MLRLIFVFAIASVGIFYALQGPFYALLFYLWNAYFRPEQWVWSDLVYRLDLSLTIGIYLVFRSLFILREFRLSKQVILILLFLGQSVVSLFLSEHWDWSLTYWIEFLKVLIVTVLITFLVNDAARFRLTFLVIAYSLGFEAVKQGWAQLVLNPGGQNNNPHPALGDNNGVAIGVLMLIPVFVALAQTAGSRWERYLHRFFIIGLFYRGISTYSRGGFLAASVLGLISFWRSPRKLRALVAMAILATIILFAMPPKFWDRMQTIRSTEDTRDAAAEGRLHFWRVAVRMADEKPLFGVGFNAFKPSFAKYDPSGGAWGDDRAVHSAWFGVLSEMGYPGLVLFLAVFTVAFVSCWRILKGTRGDPVLNDLRSYAISLQTSLIVYAVGITFFSGHYNEIFWHFIGLSVALERIHGTAHCQIAGALRSEGTLSGDPTPVAASLTPKLLER